MILNKIIFCFIFFVSSLASRVLPCPPSLVVSLFPCCHHHCCWSPSHVAQQIPRPQRRPPLSRPFPFHLALPLSLFASFPIILHPSHPFLFVLPPSFPPPSCLPSHGSFLSSFVSSPAVVAPFLVVSPLPCCSPPPRPIGPHFHATRVCPPPIRAQLLPPREQKATKVP
jgi:hypothetical protein